MPGLSKFKIYKELNLKTATFTAAIIYCYFLSNKYIQKLNIFKSYNAGFLALCQPDSATPSCPTEPWEGFEESLKWSDEP